MPRGTYDQNVFVNCPFDPSYAPIFDAIIFAIHDCGFVARCALEENDSAQVRVEKVYGIISECRLGIHDVSRTELDTALGLPRFNMPLELGIFLGAREFGGGRQRQKRCLVLDRERFRYQAFLRPRYYYSLVLLARSGYPLPLTQCAVKASRSGSLRPSVPALACPRCVPPRAHSTNR